MSRKLHPKRRSCHKPIADLKWWLHHNLDEIWIELNSRGKTILISKFDLSTVYNIIPHQKIKSVMGELINFCFDGDDKEFIGITRYGVIWSDGREKYRLLFNKTSSDQLLTR